jgi:hypothetical protein
MCQELTDKTFTVVRQSWLDIDTDDSINCFALSNICKLMSEKIPIDCLALFRWGGRKMPGLFSEI